MEVTPVYGNPDRDAAKRLNALKEMWLCAHPEDTRRFIRYAIALARENGSLDHGEMGSRGISLRRILDYQRQYEFIRDVLAELDED